MSGNQEDMCEESGGVAGDVECIAIVSLLDAFLGRRERSLKIPSHCNSGVGKALVSPASFTSWAQKPILDPVSCEAFLRQWLHSDVPRLESEPRLSMNLTRKSELLDRSSFRFNLKEALGAWTLSKSKQSFVKFLTNDVCILSLSLRCAMCDETLWFEYRS